MDYKEEMRMKPFFSFPASTLLPRPILLTPIQSDLDRHGGMRGLSYDPLSDSILVFAKTAAFPYSRATGIWYAPVELEGEFVASLTSNGHVLVLTTTGIYELGA